MRKLFTSVLLALMPLLLMAQGWPANYGGVMLQSFVWDGYDATKCGCPNRALFLATQQVLLPEAWGIMMSTG